MSNSKDADSKPKSEEEEDGADPDDLPSGSGPIKDVASGGDEDQFLG